MSVERSEVDAGSDEKARSGVVEGGSGEDEFLDASAGLDEEGGKEGLGIGGRSVGEEESLGLSEMVGEDGDLAGNKAGATTGVPAGEGGVALLRLAEVLAGAELAVLEPVKEAGVNEEQELVL